MNSHMHISEKSKSHSELSYCMILEWRTWFRYLLFVYSDVVALILGFLPWHLDMK